jgi:hypothetical protein
MIPESPIALPTHVLHRYSSSGEEVAARVAVAVDVRVALLGTGEPGDPKALVLSVLVLSAAFSVGVAGVSAVRRLDELDAGCGGRDVVLALVGAGVLAAGVRVANGTADV